MQVREIMTKDPACCVPNTSLPEVARMMAENDCGCIPVVESKTNMKPVGTITDRDIALRSVAAGKDPQNVKASEVMTSDVTSVTPEMNVQECCSVMEDQQIRRVLVVDEKGECCGIVAQADVAQYASPKQTAEVVREISNSGSFASTGRHLFDRSYRDTGNGGTSFPVGSLVSFAAGIGSGAALMYFLDPDRGRRRRALVSDQVTGLAHDAQDAIGKKHRDLQNRAKGVWAETRKAVTGNAVPNKEKNDPGNPPEFGRAATHH